MAGAFVATPETARALSSRSPALRTSRKKQPVLEAETRIREAGVLSLHEAFSKQSPSEPLDAFGSPQLARDVQPQDQNAKKREARQGRTVTSPRPSLGLPGVPSHFNSQTSQSTARKKLYLPGFPATPAKGPQSRTSGPSQSPRSGIGAPLYPYRDGGHRNAPLFGQGTPPPKNSWVALQSSSQKGEKTGPDSRKKCRTDDDCKSGTYCSYDDKVCKKVRRRINIAYLFYLSGDRRFLSVLGLYMHRKGERGFRMVFPFYWHFWGKKHQARVLFPIYWRFQNKHKERTDTLVGPFHHWKSKRGHGFNVWPLFFYSNYGKKGSRFTLLPFGHYEREGKFKGYGFLTPVGFYYGSSSPKHRTWAMLPWAYGTATPSKAFTWVFPFNFYTRTGRDKQWFLPPLAYAHRHGSTHKTFIFPLVWVWGKSNETNVIGFPFVWHFSSPQKSTTLVLTYFHARRKHWSMGGVAPFLFYGKNKKEGSRHVTLAPLFHYSSGEHGRVHRFHSVLFNWMSDKTKGKRWWLWSFPPILSVRSRAKGTDVVFPFYWAHYNKNTATKLVCVPPFLYYRDRMQRNTFLFPFWWNFRHRDTGAYVRALFPVFYQQRSVRGRTLTVAGPVYAAHGGKKPWHAGLAPLLFFGAGKKSHHAVVFPLFWHFKDKNTQTTVTGPFYWARRKKSWHAGLAPLFFMGRGKETSYATMFPLLWYLKNRKEQWTTTIAGPVYAHWGEKGWMAGLAPLFFFGNKDGRSHHIVAPLFAHWADKKKNHRTLIAGPSYYWRRGQDRGWGFAPFAFFSRRYRKGYVSSKLTILPFMHLERSRHRKLLVTPLGGYLSRPKEKSFTGVVGPVVWHRSPKSRGWAFLPWVYHWRNNKTKVTTTVGFPFIRQTTPKKTSTVVFPFYWRFTSPKEKSLVLFPFYWRLRQKKGWKADVVFPFYWNMKNDKRHLFMIPPYYRHKTKDSYTSGVWPFYHYKRNKKLKKTWMHVFPLVWYHRDDVKKTRWMVAGPYYSSKTPTTGHHGLVPFLFWGHKGAKKYRVGFPLYWDFQNDDTKKRVLFAGPFFYHRKGEEKGGGLLPLVWYRSNPAGMVQLTVAPLFHVKKDPTQFTLYTALFGWSRDRATNAHHGYVGPYIWRSDAKRRHDVVFPVFWRFHDKTTKATTTFIPPLLYWGRHTRDKKVDLVFPIVWSSRTVTSRTLVVFPFWWDKHNYHKSRTTAVLPLFYRKRNYAKKQSTWLFLPATYYKKSPKKTQFVLFPLVWHFSKKKRRGGRDSTTIAFPFYWDFKRGDSRTTIAFPFVWYFDRPNKKTVVVLNSYYVKNKKKGTYKFHCIPFFRFGRPRPGDLEWSVFGGIVGYRRIGRNRYLKLFFFSIKLEPAPRKKRPPQKAGDQKEAKNKPGPRPSTAPSSTPLPRPSLYSGGGWSPI